MDAARQDHVAEIESALAQLRLAQRHGRGSGGLGPGGGAPFGRGLHGGRGGGATHGHPLHATDAGGAGHGEAHDGPGPHGMHLRGGMGAPHGHQGGPHGRRLGDALGAARFRLLERLVEGGAASVSELANAIGVDQPRASRLVADAAARGLVRRTPDPADARRITVELTDAGRSFLESLKQSRRSAVTTALEGFSEDETATFAALLARFVQHWPATR
jgi:DNA-binding MarR family transcriptional regulator